MNPSSLLDLTGKISSPILLPSRSKPIESGPWFGVTLRDPHDSSRYFLFEIDTILLGTSSLFSSWRCFDFVRVFSLYQMGAIEGCSSTPQLEEIITEDGILCLILSSLRLKEAVATSVLSRRWRHLSTHLPELIFDSANILDDRVSGYLGDKLLHVHIKYCLQLAYRYQFIKFVNEILQRQQGRAGLKEFRVQYYLHKGHSFYIDEWVRFAVASKVKTLALYLHQEYCNVVVELYDFPCQLLALSSSIEEFSLSDCSLKPPHGFQSLNRLARLYLYRVDITEEDIYSLLGSVCSTLEKLCLWKCGPWVKLNIPHPLGQLQTLIVAYCGQFRNIEINAPKLKSMWYQGVPVDFVFKRTSQLENAEIHFDKEVSVENLDVYIAKLSRNLPHLQSLKFEICNVSNVSKVSDLPKGSNTFIHLTRLDWTWSVGVKMSLLRLASLLNASPLLEELKLRLSMRTVEHPPQKLEMLREGLPKHPHSCLKTIEIHDFYCDTWQIEIALYLFSNAVKLESMTIEKGCELFIENHGMIMEYLSQKAAAKAKLVIL